MLLGRRGAIAIRHAQNPRNVCERRRRRGRGPGGRVLGAVAEVGHAERLGHFPFHEALRLHRLHFPDGGAGRKHFHQRESQALHLVLHRPAQHAGRLHDLLVIAQRHALDVDRRFQRRQQLANVHREAIGPLVAAEGRRGGLPAERRGGSHLAAGHAVDTVVNEDHRDGFAAVGGVDDLGGADGRQVAIALVGDHDALRPAAFDRRGHRRRAPVRHLDVAHIEIVVGEYRAAHRADEHRAVLHAQTRRWRCASSLCMMPWPQPGQ